MKKILLTLLITATSPAFAGGIKYYHSDKLEMKIARMRLSSQIDKMKKVEREYKRLSRYDYKRKKYLTKYDQSDARLFAHEQDLYASGISRQPLHRATLPTGNTTIQRVGSNGQRFEKYSRPVSIEHGELYASGY